MFVYIIICLYLMLSITMRETLSTITVLDHGISAIERGSVGIQFYVNIRNDHHYSTCSVHTYPRMCCLENIPYRDCYTDTSYGDNIESLMPHRRETLIYVYPTLYPLDQIGFCNFALTYKCSKQKRHTHIDITFPFNTTSKSVKKIDYLKNYRDLKLNPCPSIDNNPMKNCAPVECDLKYSGRRPFFNTNNNKCVVVPNCDTDVHKEYPDIVYVPKSNTCRDLDKCITLRDVYGISTGLGVVTETNKREANTSSENVTPSVIIVPNCTTISENVALIYDLMTGKLCPLFNKDVAMYRSCCKTAWLSICACIAMLTATLLSIICFIHTCIWCYGKYRSGELNEVFVNVRSKVTVQHLQTCKQPSKANRECTNNLLKEVLIRDLPLELRESVEKICDRINKEVRWKKRYRMGDLGSQISLMANESRPSTATWSARTREE